MLRIKKPLEVVGTEVSEQISGIENLKQLGFDGLTWLHDVEGRPTRAWRPLDKKQVSSAFETYAKHQEKIIKNQPPPPNVSGRDLSFKELLDVLPRKFGGKRPNDKEIVDKFAEAKTPTVPKEIIDAKEQALIAILPNPKAWEAWVKMYERMDVEIEKGVSDRTKSLGIMKVWVADTGLLMSQHLGPGGANLFQLMTNAHVIKNDLARVARANRKPIHKIYKDSDWSPLRERRVDEAIAKALEDRENASSYFNDLWRDSGFVEDGFKLYEIYRDHLDFMEPKIAERGIKTVDNYLMRVRERQTALDASIKGLDRNDIVGLNDALSGKVSSGFLKDRRIEENTNKYRTDMMALFDMYNSSVINTLAFKAPVDYYSKSFKVIRQGRETSTTQFLEDVPLDLQNSKNFSRMRDEVNVWLRQNLKPNHLYGWTGSKIMRIRNNLYRTFLTMNVGAAFDNSTQKMFTQAMTPREIWPIYNKVFKQRKDFDRTAPNLHRLLEKAGRDKTYMLEVSEEELGRLGTDPKATGKKGVRYGAAKLSEYDPFFWMERTNWDDAEIAGVVEYLHKKPEWRSTVERNGGDFVKTVESMLEGNEKYQREALIQARQLSQQTQIMAGNVASPHIFRSETAKILGMFKRFKFAQIEQIVRSFNTSGTSGIGALRILGRGFPEEVAHVEALRSIETLRKGIEEVENLRRKFPQDYPDLDITSLTAVRVEVVRQEKELNSIINRIQPINKNNKASQAALWAKYSAKRLAYNFFWNILANVALDASGFGVSEFERQKDPIERAWRSAYRNAVP
ncbi:MAG: hypothetical protein ACXABY_26785, partial [Candidatus Thorarchaeota archaeon]